MATEEEKTEPSYIDYEANSASEDVGRFTSRHVVDYWERAISKQFSASSYPWNIKSKSLMKRLCTEFEPEVLTEMIDYWVTHNPLEKAVKFEYFYVSRYKIAESCQPKDYTW